MDAKEFQNYFLTNESDDDILNAHYAIVSNRIMVRERSEFRNVANLREPLFPSAYVLGQYRKMDIYTAYKEMVDENIVLVANLIKLSIAKGMHIIFLCTPNEMKIGYLEMLEKYINERFHYPCYRYQEYMLDMYEDMEYDEVKVLQKCKKIVKESRQKGLKKLLEYSSAYDDRSEKELKHILKSQYKTEDLKKIVKKFGMYTNNMTKRDMIDVIVDFT